MEGGVQNLPPGDPKLVQSIVSNMKSQGIFDQIRRDCLADLDTKPSYQNLHQRIEGYVSKVLSTETWHPDLNKNQLRDTIRRKINESGMLASGVDHVVEQVVNSKINHMFLPKIEIVVRQYLGIEKPREAEPQPQPKQQQQPPQHQVTHSQLQQQHPPLPLPPPPPPLLQQLDLNNEILRESSQQEQKQLPVSCPVPHELGLKESQEKNEKILSESAGRTDGLSKEDSAQKSEYSNLKVSDSETRVADNKEIKEEYVCFTEEKIDLKREIKNEEGILKPVEKSEQKHEEETDEPEQVEKTTPKQKEAKEGKIKRERSVSEGSTKEKGSDEKESRDKGKSDVQKKLLTDAKCLSEKEKKTEKDSKITVQDKHKVVDKNKSSDTGKAKVQEDSKHKRKDSFQSTSKEVGSKISTSQIKSFDSHLKQKTKVLSKSADVSKSRHSTKVSDTSKFHKEDSHSKYASKSSHTSTPKSSDHKAKHDSESTKSKYSKVSSDNTKNDKPIEGKVKICDAEKIKHVKKEPKTKHDTEKLKQLPSESKYKQHTVTGSKSGKQICENKNDNSNKIKHTESKGKSHNLEKKSRSNSEEKHSSKSKTESSSKNLTEKDSKHMKLKESDKEKKDSDKSKGSDKYSSVRYEAQVSELPEPKRIRTDSQSSHDFSQGNDKSHSHKSRQTHKSPDKNRKTDKKEVRDEKEKFHDFVKKTGASQSHSKGDKGKDEKKHEATHKNCDSEEGCIGKDKKSLGCKQKSELQTLDKQFKCSDKNDDHKVNKTDSGSNLKSSKEFQKNSDIFRSHDSKSGGSSPLLADKNSEESESSSSLDSQLSGRFSSKYCESKDSDYCKNEVSCCTLSAANDRNTLDATNFIDESIEMLSKANYETLDVHEVKTSLLKAEIVEKSLLVQSSKQHASIGLIESSMKIMKKQGNEAREQCVSSISKHSSDSNISTPSSSDVNSAKESSSQVTDIQMNFTHMIQNENRSIYGIKDVEDEGGGCDDDDDDDKKSTGEVSDITVSSVHTSDLSSFDDEISLSSSEDEIEESEKPSKRKMSLKEVKEMAQKFNNSKEVESEEEKDQTTNNKFEETCAFSTSLPTFKERKKKISAAEEKKSFLDSELSSKTDESSPEMKAEPKMSLRRQRKINPKYASDEFSSIFTKHKKSGSGEMFETQSQDGLDKHISEDRFNTVTKTLHKKHFQENDNRFVEESVVSDVATTNSGDESIGSLSSVESSLSAKKKQYKISETDFIQKDSTASTTYRNDDETSPDVSKYSKTVERFHEDEYTQGWHKRNPKQLEVNYDHGENSLEEPSNCKKRRISKSSEPDSAHYTITLKIKKVADHEDDTLDSLKPPKTPDPENLSSSEEISNTFEKPEMKCAGFDQERISNIETSDSAPKQEVKRKRGRPRIRPLNMDTKGTKDNSQSVSELSRDTSRPQQSGSNQSFAPEGTKTEGQGKSRPESQHSSKRYDSSDLYKPRPVIHSSTRRSRSGAHSPTLEPSKILQDQEPFDLAQKPRRHTRRSISTEQPNEGPSRGRKRKRDKTPLQTVKRRR